MHLDVLTVPTAHATRRLLYFIPCQYSAIKRECTLKLNIRACMCHFPRIFVDCKIISRVRTLFERYFTVNNASTPFECYRPIVV